VILVPGDQDTPTPPAGQAAAIVANAARRARTDDLLVLEDTRQLAAQQARQLDPDDNRTRDAWRRLAIGRDVMHLARVRRDIVRTKMGKGAEQSDGARGD
jgi:hypothetical protein